MWELTEEEIGDRLDPERENTYQCSDGSIITTIDCGKVIEAQSKKLIEHQTNRNYIDHPDIGHVPAITEEEWQEWRKAVGLEE